MRNDPSDPYDLETLELRCEQAWLRFKLAIYDLVLGKPAPEAKFNPYHDRLGRFTFAPGGAGGGAVHTGTQSPHHSERQGSNHTYQTQTTDITVTDQFRPTMNEIAKEFQAETGKSVLITSGFRDASGQAKAMYKKFKQNAPRSEYKDKIAYDEIHQAYELGLNNGDSPQDIKRAMQTVISKQMARGVYISRHLFGHAIDISTEDLTDADSDKLVEIAKRHGVWAKHEKIPDHVHLQF